MADQSIPSQEQRTLMTEGNILKILIRFAFPLFLGNLFQQMYNTVDSLVVGWFCGDNALAAVSSSGSLCFLIIGFFQGTFVGASVLISRHYGAREKDKMDAAIHTTIVFALIAGVVLSILGVLFTPTILRWMGTPENVMPNSVAYFRVYCCGLLALVLYNTANGIFQALGDSRHPLYYLMVAAGLNVVLDLLFVAVFDWGVAGAAFATSIGQAVSAGLSTVMYLFAFITINVGIFNILPVPALDGGRLIFLLFELITRRRIKPEHEAYVHFAGFVLLILLIIFVSYHDIVNLIRG